MEGKEEIALEGKRKKCVENENEENEMKRRRKWRFKQRGRQELKNQFENPQKLKIKKAVNIVVIKKIGKWKIWRSRKTWGNEKG